MATGAGVVITFHLSPFHFPAAQSGLEPDGARWRPIFVYNPRALYRGAEGGSGSGRFLKGEPVRFVWMVILLALGVLPARADVVATGTGFADIGGGETFTHRLMTQGDRARWDFSGRQYLEGSIIYRGDRGIFWVVDPLQKKYFEFPALKPGESDMRVGLLAMVYGVARNTLSAEKKAELERGISRMPLPEHLMDFTRKGTVRMGRWTCERYEAGVNGMKRGEYLTAGPKTLGLTEEDFASLEGAWQACTALYGHFDFLFPDASEGNRDGYAGFPVMWAFAQGNRTTFSLQFKSIGKSPVAASVFELPAGLKKVEVFDLLMQ